MVRLKLRRLANRPDIPLPRYESEGAAGLDLPAAEAADLPPGGVALVGTGLEIELPPGYEGQVRPRSGLALRHGVTVLNAPGTIDEDYRGELKVLLVNHGPRSYAVQVGDRVAQLVVAPVARVEAELVDALAPSGRGSEGFGHSGR